ncbi:MAG: hypothetical protein RL660_2830 [Bacteroidota bacterium]
MNIYCSSFVNKRSAIVQDGKGYNTTLPIFYDATVSKLLFSYMATHNTIIRCILYTDAFEEIRSVQFECNNTASTLQLDLPHSNEGHVYLKVLSNQKFTVDSITLE